MSFIRRIFGKNKDEKNHYLSENTNNESLQNNKVIPLDHHQNHDFTLDNDKQTDYMQYFTHLSAKSQQIPDNTLSTPPSVNSSQIPDSLPSHFLNDSLTSFSTIQDSLMDTNTQVAVNKSPLIQFREQQRQLHFKIALLGDGAVGKTALRRAYLGEGFKSEYLMTIGADFALKETTIHNNKIKFQIWDLAGQPRFSNVRGSYYNGCFGAVIVFDRTRPDTFASILQWLNELWKGSNHGPVPFVLLGNKSDLLDNDTLKMDIQADKLMQMFNNETVARIGFEVRYFFTSAKTGLNISVAFEFLAQQILAWMKMRNIKKDNHQ